MYKTMSASPNRASPATSLSDKSKACTAYADKGPGDTGSATMTCTPPLPWSHMLVLASIDSCCNYSGVKSAKLQALFEKAGHAHGRHGDITVKKSWEASPPPRHNFRYHTCPALAM